MFDKLISRFQTEKTSAHPLATDASLNALMADIPQSDPRRLLLDVDEHLDGMEAAVAEIGPALVLRALTRLDQFSRLAAEQLLARYLTVGKREYLADSVWSLLDTHAGHLFRCYHSFLKAQQEPKSSDDKVRMARYAACALMAWALRKKLQRFRYRVPGVELWREAHQLLQVLGRLGLLKTRVVAYRDEAETSPLDEYLIGLYLEFVPVGNVVPQQLEFAEGFLRSCRGLELTEQPQELSTDCIDLAGAQGPQRLKQGDPGGPGVRYCAVRGLRAALVKLALQMKSPQGAPEWLARVPASREQMEGAVLILMTYWGQAPPARGNDRAQQKCELRVVLGFGLARRMIAAAHYARMGHSFEYEGVDFIRMFDESRFGTVAVQDETCTEGQEAAAPAVPLTPMEILRQIETDGDHAQMERWIQVDGSATGIGVVVPAVLARHRIGLLICMREADGMDWRLGLIRRIGRDGANRPSIGVETLPWPSLCAVARPVGDDSAWSNMADGGDGWSDCIIVSAQGKELILPAGAFVAGLEVEVRSEAGRWSLRLESLLDRGADYDRIEFSRIS